MNSVFLFCGSCGKTQNDERDLTLDLTMQLGRLICRDCWKKEKKEDEEHG